MQQSIRGSGPVAVTGSHGTLRAWAVVSGLVVEFLGLSVMVGWVLHIDALTRVAPGLATMKFNTACCLMLLGAALVAGAQTWAARAVSVIVAAIATVSLAQYATGLNVGIDEAFFRDVAGGTSYPGRMAMTTGICFLLAATALHALRVDRRRLLTGAALTVFTLGWLGCLGYLFGVRGLYNVGPFSTMAAPTAAAMVILGVGLLASAHDGPLHWIVRGDDPGAMVLRRILPFAFIGVPILAELRLQGQLAGWYGLEFGLAMMVVVASLIVVVGGLLGARVINRSHAAVLTANDGLRDMNATLATRIAERTEELRTSEAWARTLADSAPVGIFHSDLNGVRTYVNERMCEIYGISKEEALGNAIGTGIHVEDRERVLAGWADALQTGVEFDSEFRVQQPAGDVLWVRAHGAQVRGIDGVLTGSVGTVADITARRRSEQAVQDAEELFRTSFESSPIGIALVDSNGRLVRANRALCELTGYPLDRLVGMRAQSLLSSEEVGFNEARTVEATGVDQRIKRADGSVRWASIRYARIGQDAAGNPVLTMAQFIDTTERRDYEERLARMANRDSLTGLMNRRSFETALAAQVARCKRYGPAGAVLMLDIDHFKQVNDEYGHNVGDQVIVATADRLHRRLRETDLIARLGGDEFVVLLPVGTAVEARAVAQILVDEIHDDPVTVAGEHIAVTASIGVAAFDDTPRSPSEMLVNADLAMYDAKESGRDLWAEFVAGSAGMAPTQGRLYSGQHPLPAGLRAGREAGTETR